MSEIIVLVASELGRSRTKHGPPPLFVHLVAEIHQPLSCLGASYQDARLVPHGGAFAFAAPESPPMQPLSNTAWGPNSGIMSVHLLVWEGLAFTGPPSEFKGWKGNIQIFNYQKEDWHRKSRSVDSQFHNMFVYVSHVSCFIRNYIHP